MTDRLSLTALAALGLLGAGCTHALAAEPEPADTADTEDGGLSVCLSIMIVDEPDQLPPPRVEPPVVDVTNGLIFGAVDAMGKRRFKD